jgi:hypothetical protein
MNVRQFPQITVIDNMEHVPILLGDTLVHVTKVSLEMDLYVQVGKALRKQVNHPWQK